MFPVLQSEQGDAERGLQGENWGPLGKIRNTESPKLVIVATG